MDRDLIDRLTGLRRELHHYPDLPGREEATCTRLKGFLESVCSRGSGSYRIIDGLGGGGLALIFDSGREGPALMLRCETDALPIEEPPLFSYASFNEGVSHKCGHDGHMSILAGVATLISSFGPDGGIQRGRLILLFQPAEETGRGALAVLKDSRYGEIRPDYIFALHNWPGIPHGTVSVKPGGMFAASTGMTIKLTGKSAHASAPEEGVSPIEGIKRIHSLLPRLCIPDRSSGNFSLITTVGIRAGGSDFGVSPGSGEIFLTVRAYRQEVLDRLLEELQFRARKIALEENLEIAFGFQDSFPSAENSPEAVEIVRRAAESCGIRAVEPAQGTASSEDIGHLLRDARRGGAVFLLGNGEEAPPLHSRNYDFDDTLIETGVRIWMQIIEDMLN